MPTRANAPARTVGDHLRHWRQHRRLSQLDLALDTGISQKHLSFVESGRSLPSRAMILRLAGQLDVPLRMRNRMLDAAGYAPVFRERALDDPALAAARAAIDVILTAHAPFPALAIDRHWTLVAGNAAIPHLLDPIAEASLLQPPVNVLRLSLHPGGLAPRIANLPEWRAHLIERLHRQIEATADADLRALADELAALPGGEGAAAEPGRAAPEDAGLFVPLRLHTGAGLLSFFSTTTVFGTPVEITLSELAIEAFFPAEPQTAEALRRLVPGPDIGESAPGAK